MYSVEEFDKAKTKILRYILYKKRTENEVRTKFKNDIDEEMLEDAIEYLKEAKYIDDEDYIEKTINNFKILKKMSIMELKYKLQAKGLNKDLIEDYIYQNKDELIEYEINSAEKIILRKDQEKPEMVAYLMKKGYKRDNINKAFERIEN
jgi:regulatory protein